MPMSEDERRELRALAAQLVGQRRLVVLSRRLGTASVDNGLCRVKVLWLAGGGLGLGLVVAGAVTANTAVLAAAVAVLAATLVLVGVSSVIVEIKGAGESIAPVTAASRVLTRTGRASPRPLGGGQAGCGFPSCLPLPAVLPGGCPPGVSPRACPPGAGWAGAGWAGAGWNVAANVWK